MPQSIRHLIALPELRSRLLSGAGGLDRPVRWAHVCELDDPTEWLGEGDLLMTTGLGIPSDAERQRRYVRRLAEAGLAGMMIGENMEAPSDLDALRETAEALGFPLILTHYGVPFAAVTRAIVDAGQKDEYERRNALARIYESARLSMQGLACRRCCNASARTCEAASTSSFPTPWRPGSQACQGCPWSWPTRCATAVASRRSRSHGPSPSARGRRSAQHRHSFRPELPADSPGRAAAGLQSPAPPDGSARHRDRTAARRKRTPPAPGFGIARRPAATTAIPGTSRGAAGGTAARARSRRCSRFRGKFRGARDRPYRSFPGPRLTPAGSRARPGNHSAAPGRPRLDTAGSPGQLAGRERPARRAERCAEALREARPALAHSHSRRPLCRYAELDDEAPWLPRSLAEAERAFRLVLGTLHDYDAANGSALLHTLQVFLEENRSWLNAQRLHIHKQSLVYRIRRIEEISGRSLDSTADVATLWFALQATRLSPEARGRTAKGSLLEQSAHHGGDMD